MLFTTETHIECNIQIKKINKERGRILMLHCRRERLGPPIQIAEPLEDQL